MSDFAGRPPSARGYRPPSGTGMRPASGAKGRGMVPPSSMGRPPGTAMRMPPSTGMVPGTARPGSRAGEMGGALNSQIRVADRPMTKQGLTGMKTSAGRGPQRTIYDKSYYMGQLRAKITDLATEISKLQKETESFNQENATFLTYEKRAEGLASEIKELQGQLADYNTLLDKINTDTEMDDIVQDFNALKIQNEREQNSIDELFTQRRDKENQIKQLELELDQERRMAESLVEDMPPDQKAKYAQLKNVNNSLKSELEQKQQELDALTTRVQNLEEEVSSSAIKQEENLPPFQIVFLRFSAAALVLLPVLLFQGRSAFKSARLSMHAARGLLLALGIGLWCFGLNLMPFASCVVINNTMPFFKMLFAQLILGEKVGKQRWLASLAGFIGCLIVFNPTAATFQPQSLVLLLSACCFAMLDIFNKKYTASETVTSMLFYGAISTAAIAAVRAIPHWVPVTTSQFALIGCLGVGANFLLYCLLKAFKYVDASATCPYRYTEFVLSALAGFFLFKELPSKSTLLGSCIILPSVIYTAYMETRATEPEKEETVEA